MHFSQGIIGFFYNTSNSGLLSDQISDILIDDEDRIWVSTDTGLVMFVPNQESSAMDHNSIANLKKFFLPSGFLAVFLIVVNAIALTQPSEFQKANLVEFGWGILGFFLFTSLFWIVYDFVRNLVGEGAIFQLFFFLIPLRITIITLIFFTIKRQWVALGIFSAVI